MGSSKFWVFLFFLVVIGVATDHPILLINHTGLKIVRIEIDNRKFEEVSGRVDEILVDVTHEKHNMRLIFKGGAHLDWPNFDFKGVRQITFERVKSTISARTE